MTDYQKYYAEYLKDFLLDQTGVEFTFSHMEGDKYIFFDSNGEECKVTAHGS